MEEIFKPRLILIDDEIEVLQSLERIFRREYETIAFNDPIKAIEFIKLTPIHIIICDMRMPEISGDKVLAQAKQHQPKARRILLSGYSDMASTIAAINEGGIHAYVAKPWDNQQLKDVVNDALHTIKLEIENQKLTIQLQENNQKLIQLNKQLDKKVEERTITLKQTVLKLKKSIKSQRNQLQQVIDMITLISAEHRKDHHQHDMRIAKQCRLLGHQMGLEKVEVTYLFLAAQLHAIGEIALSNSLLNKPESQMNNAELLQLHQQATKGADILDLMPSLKNISDILRFQYEKFNGLGFPGERHQNDIPLSARILAVIRDYDKQISGYASGKKISPRDALQNIKSQANKSYDNNVVLAFDNLLHNIPAGSNTEFCFTLDMLKPGMVIAHDVKYKNGNILLTQHTKLTEVTIERLEQYELEHDCTFLVFILIPQNISEEVS
ncbi:HD domain-containing phosphohydrolase [Pseudoalteromonas denitrificans]|uniref:Response regulator c-di-GMP phosphodiesterase, RpfG family, contains REC and HD-GYP domains n=1 Tax=Pseudoalteromonas denitrificans DSM 6059 TaxID=1123010 RepID=A0A1I1JVN5_9GAMM|nr:HD domain-containing phosphohydrolase [Pseudoalteromonas denitrificans]SFC49853.1 Response regulator c-di-GMP phosphodiesterase, RpfG family, contains REC and HD-GYP domains [Pseudoalteromonas denitrificans DSM 6059]